MNLGVFGGTFDPVHIGHLVLAESAREQLDLDRVLWMVAGDPWRKREQAVSGANHRVEMVRLAIEGNPAFELRTDEVSRAGPTYTVETLRALKVESQAELFLLIGEDALWDLPGWRSPEEIVELATLVVAGRGLEHNEDKVPDQVKDLDPQPARLEMPLIDVSSTDIRRRIQGGRSVRYVVPAEVEQYIRETGLYVS
jgi:nicotinate-nucleotide adenylyltransferase